MATQLSPGSHSDKPVTWHVLTAEEAAALLHVDPHQGLSSAEANKRLAHYGPNRLAEQPLRPIWLRLLEQFKSLLILVLILAAGVAAVVGDLQDTAVILVVVLFNAVLGFYQEYRAERSLVALKNMLALQTRVRRDGAQGEVAADMLVPGDIVLLEAGDRIPADGRLLECHQLEVDEAALTGESLTVGKQAGPLADARAPLAKRINMAYMNTVVTRGRAELLVTATGMQTEMGRIADLMAAAPEGATPLQIQLDRLGKRLAGIAGVVVTGIFLLAVYQGQPLAYAALTAITLAVAAIPEGLPAVVTVTLALGMRRMAARRAIVKRLAAVETLGCTTVICSDKTGTLTLNQMTARAFYYRGRRFRVTGEGYRPEGEFQAEDSAPLPELLPLLLPAALCNDSRVQDGQLVGDPTEGALAVLAVKGGVELLTAAARLPRIAEIPFDAAHKFMATFHADGDQVQVFVKGAPDVLLAHCRCLAGELETMLDEAVRHRVLAENEALAAQALRVLAVASRTLPANCFDPAGDLFAYVDALCLQGLVGLIDPPRPEAREAIAACRTAGIAVKMITGDHPATAAAVAHELGLDGDLMTGAEFAVLSSQELAEHIDSVAVFARVAPEHKVRIVQALQSHGQVVAMTGDGVNDAPALKTADIGVAMGSSGTEVSKEAGTLVLTDDNFTTIVGAVQEGRTIYDNLVKFVRFQLGTNLGALATVLGASLLGLPVPFNPVQILWVNIIMDGPPAMALGVDPPRPGLLSEPPRDPKAEILTLRRLGQLAVFGLTMAVGTLAVLYYGLASGDPSRALTLTFTTFVLLQLFNVFNARAETGSAFTQHFFGNPLLWLALIGVITMQILAVHWGPAQAIFHTQALSLADWGVAVAVAASVLLLEEARKLITRLLI
jgi:Ca2+-transporting ATPase